MARRRGLDAGHVDDGGTDIEVVRGDEGLIGEVKGRTSGKATDADIAYGQLLRRMTYDEPSVRYAVIVPTSSLWHAERVQGNVRRLLRIDLHGVTDDDAPTARVAPVPLRGLSCDLCVPPRRSPGLGLP